MKEHTIHYTSLGQICQEEVANLFTSAFSASEGEQEGKLVGNLAAELSALIDDQDVIAMGAEDEGSLIGCIFFSRLFVQHPIWIFMLAPVAVSTERQGQGVVRGLIHHGLQELRRRSVEVVVTYGDPAFYAKAGFTPLSERAIQAPLPLSRPEGWLGCSLTGEPIPTIPERPTCVEPFRNPAYW